ncbi:hypothetical protein ACOSQ3_003430 [Xanthoceras sorbifolium]
MSGILKFKKIEKLERKCKSSLPFGSPSSSVKTVLIESSITSPCSPFDLTDKRRLGCIWSCWCARIGLVIGVFRLVPILVENGGVGVSGSGGLELLWCSTLALQVLRLCFVRPAAAGGALLLLCGGCRRMDLLGLLLVLFVALLECCICV